jgi:hypothetical protein
VVAAERPTYLRGVEATPKRLLMELPDADALELHVHGVLLPDVSDVPVLVLSPGADDSGYLTSSQIATLTLPRHPVVFLGACFSGQSASYGPVHASLPAAFMRAGARMVLAATGVVEDAEAGDFFDGVRRRISKGAKGPIALRDERLDVRWRNDRAHWGRDIVLFQ